MSTKTSFLLLLCAFCVYANPRVDIPVVFSSGGRPILGIGMGTPGVGSMQGFNFTLTTSSGYTSVANDNCGDCSDIPRYNMSLSPDAQNLPGAAAVGLGSGNFSGSLMKENCTMNTDTTTVWSYNNQTVIRMNNTSTTNTPFSDGVSGLVGLGTLKTPTISAGFPATFGDSIYGQFFIRNPNQTNFTFGLALHPSPVIPGNSSTQLTFASGAQPGASQSAGIMNWIQADSANFDANSVVYRNVSNGVSGGYLANNEQPDWTVQLNGWSANIGNSGVANGNNILVNVDPYYSGIYLPASQATLLYGAIPGATEVPLSTINGQTSAWLVPCNTTIQFIVHVDQQQFIVDQSLIVQHINSDTCISIIEGFTDSSVTQYIFGQSWISQLYVMFTVPQNGGPSIAFAPRVFPSTSSTNVGAIVGGVVGGVAGVVALGLLGFYLIRSRHDKAFFKRAAELEEERQVASTVEPYTFGHHPTLPGAAYPSPGASPHAPLLDRDAGPLPHFPPSYEEASEAGSSSTPAPGSGSGSGPRSPGYPNEKGGYRRETTMTNVSNVPVSPDAAHSTFGDSTTSGGHES